MIKETRTYTDYNGVQRTEDFYFNLNKAELVEMQYSVDGGFAETLQKIIDAQETTELIKIFKELVLKAYGKKSLDGRRFEKSEEISREFAQTEAYSDLFMELATDADKASKFINGILPAETNPVPAPANK